MGCVTGCLISQGWTHRLQDLTVMLNLPSCTSFCICTDRRGRKWKEKNPERSRFVSNPKSRKKRKKKRRRRKKRKKKKKRRKKNQKLSHHHNNQVRVTFLDLYLQLSYLNNNIRSKWQYSYFLCGSYLNTSESFVNDKKEH